MPKKLIETHFDPQRNGTVIEFSAGCLRVAVVTIVTLLVYGVLRSCGY